MFGSSTNERKDTYSHIADGADEKENGKMIAEVKGLP